MTINLFYKDFSNSKGLPFWNKEQIKKRQYIKEYLINAVESILLNINQAWRFEEWEAPILTPLELINKNYSEDDYFITYKKIFNEDFYNDISSDYIYGDIRKGHLATQIEDKVNSCKFLATRPETTMGSYIIAQKLLNEGYKLPLCVYQSGKSFRKEESDQSMQTHKRFTEFYQLEFQCLYSSNSKADYYNEVINKLSKYIEDLLKLEVRLIESDRLPDYSNKTFDIEVKTPEKWLEICSISDRKDFSESVKNVEIAFGLDRLVLV